MMLLYGKSAKTLGHDTKEGEISAIRAQMNTEYKAMTAASGKQAKIHERNIEKLERKYEELLEDDRTDYAQGIIDKVFLEFKKGKQWVDRMVDLANKKFYVFSPIGRVRHLYAVLLGDREITSRQVRRGMNAPIQGFASEIAIKGARLVTVTYYDELQKLKEMVNSDTDGELKFNRIVHDASYFSVVWPMVIPFIHQLQWASTYGVSEAYEREFGLKFTIEPEIEMEVGVKDTATHKWNWAIPHLLDSIDQSVKLGIEAGYYKDTSYKEIMDQILEPWRNKKTRAYLNKKWPILGVDLEEEIHEAVAAFDARAKKGK
jgi:hypothetical protein